MRRKMDKIMCVLGTNMGFCALMILFVLFILVIMIIDGHKDVSRLMGYPLSKTRWACGISLIEFRPF